MVANNNILAACSEQSNELDACGNAAFKVINAMSSLYDYKKGLGGNK